MDRLEYDVLIVTAAGRGAHLAAEVAQGGNKVLCIDLTSQLGVWPPEDLVGPFGEFAMDRYSSTYKEMLNHGDPYLSIPQGFCVWHENGPLEFRGSLTRNMLEKLSLDPGVVDLICDQKELRTPLDLIPFKRRWPLTLIASLASSFGEDFDYSTQGPRQGQFLFPVYAEFLFQHPTRPGMDNLNRWVRSKNVVLTDQTLILDFAKESQGLLTGAELTGELSGLVKFKQLIWCLTSEETYFISEKVGKIIFPDGSSEPDWSWVRYRVHIQQCQERDRLPSFVVLLMDRYSPWSHENLCLVTRTAVEEFFDVWIKIPSLQRFNKDYLREHGTRIEKVLGDRMPQSSPQIQTYPQEYSYTWKDIGPSRFPIYQKKKIKFKGVSYSNVQIDSAELRGSYARPHQYDEQLKMIGVLQAWKEAERVKAQKNNKEKGKDL